ncbi:s-methyl-5-thioribose-1-phosphate isomerase [Saccharothrix coeruleofusca]|uniref:Methylthioribose-1-phosphate isomerase n=1 Tax=Saccharothrix coeruleofusca TaxID=33919 RepID=A0A918AHZ3_9PSEU|nr:s-methyl-5-thioribose-1-phosphate isomerase [Saccharothrix coeruleofusca]GGP44409.1 methylthioribose-1-phosphate isomerase [Saccharothrix coeruleofusca]
MEPVLANSVRLADDGVHVLDRRGFPFERTWVRCATVAEVAKAVEDMVTQSSGPYFAVLWGMVLAAREARGLPPERAVAHLERAGELLVATRPTNNHLRKAVAAVLAGVRAAVDEGRDVEQGALEGARAGDERYRRRSRALGAATAELLPEDGAVLTHCWADLYLTETVAAAQRAGKRLRFFCTETRPYLQGARLTAETLAEMGVDTTLITDGMGAAVLASGEVDVLLTAADRVTMDGHVVNKVGTLGLAVAASAFGVPFLAMVQAPDRLAPTAADVPIEHRPGEEVLHTLGRRTASDRVRGHYPAFDVTPPRFVTTVVTDRGPYAPDRLADYYADEQGNAG